MADGHEGAADLELLDLAGLGVAQAHGRELAVVAGDELLGDVGRLQADVGAAWARSSMIFEARNSSRRWTMVSSEAYLEMKIESSIAESPPPITTTFSPLKKAPSQTPQVETPRPPSSISPGNAEPLRLRAHGEDDALRQMLGVAHPDAVDAAVGELDPGRVVGDEAGPEALRLGAEAPASAPGP